MRTFNKGSIHADHGRHVKAQLTANLQRLLMFLASLLDPPLDTVSPMYHRRRYNPPLADPRPNPFPFELLLQRASDLKIRTAQASSGCRTFLRPRPIFVRSCDSRSAARPAVLSCRRKRMALPARDSGSDAGSMDAEARLGRGGSRKRCGERSRQLPLTASRSPRRCDFVLYSASYCSWLK